VAQGVGGLVGKTVGAAGWPGLRGGKRVIATFSNDDSPRTAHPLRNATPPWLADRIAARAAFGFTDIETEGVE
jgi:hypothetical protein